MNTEQVRRPPRRRLLVALAAVALAVVPVSVWLVVRVGGDPPRAAPGAEEDPRPTAAVAVGDSFASGEAAGGYERNADGSEDACHRSAAAQIHQADLPGIDHAVNLACVGATTANIRLGGQGQHGQPPQAVQLRSVATDYNVELVVVTVGANDLGWGDLLLDCVLGLLPTADRCQERWAQRLPERTEAISRQIEQAVGDVRAVLRDAGQDDGDYELVLQSYASPVAREAPGMSLGDRVRAGCPLPTDAMVWANDELLPQLAGMVRAAATASRARFLDLTQAFRGHQVCVDHATDERQWVAGLQIDPALIGAQLLGGVGVDVRALRTAMHPNARGHAQLGRCLAGFYATDHEQGACEATGQGGARMSVT